MSSLKTNEIHLDLHIFLFAPDTYNYSYHLLSTRAFINSLNPHYYLWDRHYPHFTDDKLRQRAVKQLSQHHTASIFNGKFELRQFDSTSHIHHYTLFPDRSVLDGKLNINYLSYLLFFYFSCKDPFLTLHLLTLLIMLKIHCLKNAWYFISLILIHPDVLKQPKNQLFLIVQYLLNWL